MSSDAEARAKQRSAGTRDLASVPFSWPKDPRLRERVRRFHEELHDPAPVEAAFLDAFLEDQDGEGTERPDLAEAARARLRIWGGAGDAVWRTCQLFRWLCGDVLPFAFPEIDLPPGESIEDAREVGEALVPHVQEAGEAWFALRPATERLNLDRPTESYEAQVREHPAAWDRLQALSAAADAAKWLPYVPRRLNPTKYTAQLRRDHHPLHQCETVALDCGAAFLYANRLQPLLVRTLEGLADPRREAPQVENRARQALHEVGITDFGPRLTELASALVEAYDRVASRRDIDPHEAVEIADSILPADRHEAVQMLTESPQLSARPLPSQATSFTDGAWDVLVRAMAEVATRLHATPRRGA